jgi:hypothetical protein
MPLPGVLSEIWLRKLSAAVDNTENCFTLTRAGIGSTINVVFWGSKRIRPEGPRAVLLPFVEEHVRIGRIIGIVVTVIVLSLGWGGGSAMAQVGGQAEFGPIGNSSFVVPAGVSKIRASVYGGGGGAGATIVATSPGANGGSGAFGQGVITVTPGETITIVVGAGGAGGQPGTSQNGKAGGATKILHGATVLLSAGGGGGGSCAGCAPFSVGKGGAIGIGPSGSVLHAGPDGNSCGGGQTRCGYTLPDFTTSVSIGGRGFFNGGTSTISGIQGYVYLEW